MFWPKRFFFNSSRKYNIACASEIFSPMLRLSARTICNKPTPPSEWRHGIIVGLAHIGDVLFRTASLPILADAFPNCKWSFLLEESSAGILRNNPHVDRILPFRESNHFPYLSTQNTALLREYKYDVALCASPQIYWTDLLTSVLLRIPNRIAFVNKGLTGLITFPVKMETPLPFAISFKKMVSEVTGVLPNWDVSPKVYLDITDYDKSNRAWEELKLGMRPVIAVCPATRQMAQTWSIEYMAELIDVLQTQTEYQCVLCGGINDKDLLKSIESKCSSEVAMNVGMLELLGLAAFFKRCHGVVCMDSGPRHIANAVNIPVFFFRNLAVNSLEVGVYCSNETDLTKEGDFMTPLQQTSHLNAILPQTVVDVIKMRLSINRENNNG